MDHSRQAISPSFEPSEVQGWHSRFPTLPEAHRRTLEVIQLPGEVHSIGAACACLQIEHDLYTYCMVMVDSFCATRVSVQALFVPSGWHHSVENLEDTLSINHNWINGFNVAWSVCWLCSTFQRAADLLCDCRNESQQHTQTDNPSSSPPARSRPVVLCPVTNHVLVCTDISTMNPARCNQHS
jgi:hypothetical protein